MKSKKWIKIISLLLGVTTLFSVFATACKDETTEEEKELEEVTEYETYDGTHVYTAPDTDEYLVQNGRTEYTLVIPAESTSMIRTARDEFVDLFKDATSIEIPCITDEGLTHNANTKYVSIGKTTLLQSAGITIDQSELGADGHRVVTKDHNVYLCGGLDEGTLFAVYTFMKLTFNFETYYLDCMEIERCTEKRLKAFDVTDIPDFQHRGLQDGLLTTPSFDYDESMYRYRMRYYGARGYNLMPVHKTYDPTSNRGTSTNIKFWFPEEVYKEEHANWFSVNGGEQACFTARGDEAEYQAMLDESLKKIIFSLETYPTAEYPHWNAISMTQADNLQYCTCDNCSKIAKEYETQAAVQLFFLNDLAVMVDEWLAENTDHPGYREDFTIYMFAYQYTIAAPARYNAATKEYESLDGFKGKLDVHDRVGVFFAITNMDGQFDLFDETNSEGRVNVEKWCALTDNILYWHYGTNFRCFIWMYDSFELFTPQAYAWFANRSNRHWFVQLQTGSEGTNTGWHNLKTYLGSKLSWDSSLDMEQLIDDYFNAMFKDAAPRMKRLFVEQRAYMREVIIDEYHLHGKGDGRPNLSLSDYWDLATLEIWLEIMDQAKEDVARYQQTDPDLYKRICQHIDAEAISVLYVILDTQSGKLTREKYVEYVNRLKFIMLDQDLKGMKLRAGASFYDWVMSL